MSKNKEVRYAHTVVAQSTFPSLPRLSSSSPPLARLQIFLCPAFVRSTRTRPLPVRCHTVHTHIVCVLVRVLCVSSVMCCGVRGVAQRSGEERGLPSLTKEQTKERTTTDGQTGGNTVNGGGKRAEIKLTRQLSSPLFSLSVASGDYSRLSGEEVPQGSARSASMAKKIFRGTHTTHEKNKRENFETSGTEKGILVAHNLSQNISFVCICLLFFLLSVGSVDFS